jgi:hypothetical protein
MNVPTMPFSSSFIASMRVRTWLLTLMLMGIGSSLMAQSGYYHLIAGSFDEFGAASQLVETLKIKNQKSVLLFPTQSSQRYRVSVFQSLDRDAVDAYQRALARKGEGQSYWILSLEPGSKAMASTSGHQTANANLRMRGSEIPSDGTGNVYHLITGSFDNLTAADRSMLALEAQGYEPYLLNPQSPTDNYRVSVYRSMDREEITTYSNLLRKRGKKSGWIYEETPGANTMSFRQPVSGSGSNANLTTSTQASASQGATFHLIAGSYDRFDQASQFADAMRNQGYNPLIMFPETGVSKTFRVSVYQSTQRNRVEQFQQQLVQKGTKGWIYAQK